MLLHPGFAIVNIQAMNTRLDRYFQVTLNQVTNGAILSGDNLRSRMFCDRNMEQTLPLFTRKQQVWY